MSRSATFRVRTATAPANADVAGGWLVVVSATNDFSMPNLFKRATAEPPGLSIRAYSFEITDVVVAGAALTVGRACPATNRAANGTNVTLVVCGVNHTNTAQRISAAYAISRGA